MISWPDQILYPTHPADAPRTILPDTPAPTLHSTACQPEHNRLCLCSSYSALAHPEKPEKQLPTHCVTRVPRLILFITHSPHHSPATPSAIAMKLEGQRRPRSSQPAVKRQVIAAGRGLTMKRMCGRVWVGGISLEPRARDRRPLFWRRRCGLVSGGEGTWYMCIILISSDNNDRIAGKSHGGHGEGGEIHYWEVDEWLSGQFEYHCSLYSQKPASFNPILRISGYAFTRAAMSISRRPQL